MKSRTHFISLALFALLLALFTTHKATAAGWYDVNWSYRRLITVPPGSEVLSAFQVKITLNSSFNFSKAKPDGSDIRFTSQDGTSLIPFWIESWDPAGLQATIWIKVPSIPVTGAYVYLYYGNLSPTIPPPNSFETPPVGPFTRATGNPIVLAGHPSGSNASLLAENIVYDDVSGRYWLIFADYGLGGVGLAWSNTPSNPASWTYSSINIPSGNAPHIIKEGGLWYIFYSTTPPANIVYRTCSTINGTYSSPVTVLTPSATWEAYRVDEPYVFKRNDGKWILAYMGDAGSVTEQVGYAYADVITGPYTKFAGNPCIPFGPSGSFDAGTVADPWVYEYYGVYYIGYTVSSTKLSPWQTAVATTTDWQTFTKLGVILPASGTALDAQNSFRGAVIRIGNTYVFSYTNGQFRMGIATQPVFFDPAGYINNPEAVFDFFDGFSGTALNTTKWTVANGNISQATVSGGLLTLTAPSDAVYIRILATSSFGMNYMGETYSRHPNQGASLKIAEYGFADEAWNTVRIVDDFQLGTTYWQRQAKLAGPTDVFLNMAQTANQNWHIFHTYRQSPNNAGFQIDDYPVETVTTGNPPSQTVPTGNLPPFLMSYGAGNQIIVDWTRVRKWAGSDPTPGIGGEQIQTSSLVIAIDTITNVSCYGGSNGAIDISVSGGSAPYTYLWTPGGQTTQDITGKPAGSYSVLVTDSYLNTANSGVIVITQPAALLVNSAITSPIVCSEGTATVLISATGGTSPYTGVGSFPQSVGTTVYNVTDVKGCSSSISVTINAPAPWYNNSWQYRREVTVTNPGVAALTEYQMMISLNSSFDFANAKGDGTDIRFTSNDGTTLIPFWLETWNPAGYQANIWIKVPTIPIGGTSVYLYYGNPTPTIDIPVPVEVPPTGPFTRAVGNPIIPAGATGTSLLAENIVYDDVTGHYWMCLANYSQAAISLCYSDNPTDPAAWIWNGNVITTFTQYYSGAPHLLKHGSTWYLFYADRPHIKVATASNVAGPYTIYPTPMLAPSGPSPAWDNFRVDEPYVFKRASDNKWVIVYMGDSGGATEQVGYATADNILGPYTTYSGNPCIAFGPPGSFDAGTIADPWVYKYHDVYYIGYTVSPTNASPWQTACATTTDWLSFTKLGVIFPVAISGWDAVNSFRGAVTRVADTYVFSYTGDGYKMGIATQPVYMTPPTIINNVDAVFDFYDGFNGTALDGSKWYFGHGNSSSASVGGGNLTLTHTTGSDYPSLISQPTFGMNYLVETLVKHPEQGTLNMVIETGFNINLGDMVRLVDDFPASLPNPTATWNRQTKLSSQGGDPNWVKMSQAADQNWHVLKIFRQSPGTAGFQIDETPIETTSNSVPTSNLPVFLMSYTESAPNHFIVDWIRVRKYAGVNPTTSVGGEQIQILVNGYISYYNTVYTPMGNVTVNLPGSSLPSTTTSSVPAGPLNKIGYFKFNNVCPGTYNVVVSTSDNVSGINVTDAAQTNYWGVFFGDIEKVRFLAGDVNGDHYILSADASNILQYFLTQGNPDPPFSGSAWRFWKTGDELITNNPGPEGYPTINVSGSNVTQNLYGLVTGDFNQSFIPGGMKAVSESLTLIYGETISIIPDMEFDLPLSVAMDMEVGAVSLIMEFPSDLLEVNGVFLSDDPNIPLMHSVSGDELRIGWNSLEPISLLEGESLLTLKVKLIGLPGEEGIRFKLAADPLNELADGDYNVISNAVLSIDAITTSMTGTGEISLSDRLTLANHPNPFTGKTTFTYSLPVDGKVTLEICDIVGNKVKSLVDVTQSAGDYVLSLDEATLQPGVYTATIKLDSNGNLMTRTIKIISKQ